MHPDTDIAGLQLFAALFSDEPMPDVEAAIVMAHPGDEAVSASWLMVRLQERASVYCLTKASHGCPGGVTSTRTREGLRAAASATIASAALAGVPEARCHNLGLAEAELANDLETLVWLTTAAVTAVRPRVLITHACEGYSLDHDATAFAVHMTARMMSRCGGGAPMVVEVPRHQVPDEGAEQKLAIARRAVRIEFGPESKKVKRRMLRCHCQSTAAMDANALHSEEYVLAPTGNALEGLFDRDGAYLDASWCTPAEFRRNARQVAAALTSAVLSTPSRA
jgi:hypothetical protein